MSRTREQRRFHRLNAVLSGIIDDSFQMQLPEERCPLFVVSLLVV